MSRSPYDRPRGGNDRRSDDRRRPMRIPAWTNGERSWLWRSPPIHLADPGLRHQQCHGIAVLAGVLVVGIGIGSAVTSTTQGDQGNIASAQQLDMAVPDPEFCQQWGASAFVMDIEMYTTLNPSSSFVTQPTLQPGCVIRRENWAVLRKEGAITSAQERECKQRMNTFAYIGSVRDKPVVRCVYQTDISQNKFLTRGVADDTVGITPEADQF